MYVHVHEPQHLAATGVVCRSGDERQPPDSSSITVPLSGNRRSVRLAQQSICLTFASMTTLVVASCIAGFAIGGPAAMMLSKQTIGWTYPLINSWNLDQTRPVLQRHSLRQYALGQVDKFSSEAPVHLEKLPQEASDAINSKLEEHGIRSAGNDARYAYGSDADEEALAPNNGFEYKAPKTSVICNARSSQRRDKGDDTSVEIHPLGQVQVCEFVLNQHSTPPFRAVCSVSGC